ncbi:MAG: PH domain-containing protein [bacterium]|nr:PH domain-containing protein [bacterium]
MKTLLQLLGGADPQRNRAFPGEQPNEEVEFMSIFHWMKLMPFFLKMLVLVVAAVLLFTSSFFQGLSPMLHFSIISLFSTLCVHVVCFRAFEFFLRFMMITNYRVIDIRNGVFLKREMEVIPMTNIQDTRSQQRGIFSRIFKYGDLIILGSSTDVKYQFHYVHTVSKIHYILNEILQKVVSQNLPRGLRKNGVARESEEPVPAG